MTDGGGYAAARLMPVNRAGTVTATVSAPAHPEAEALTFTCNVRLPRVDLFQVDWGATHVSLNEDCGGGRTTSGPGPAMWPARPGEACSKVLGIRVTDLVEDGQIPVEGVEVRPVALDAFGNPAAGLAEFLPSRGRTDAAGKACFATVLAPGVDLPELRIRFELPAIDAGDGTPLGCAWRLPVSGEPWLTKVIGGQSQVALPGRTVPGAVVFTGGETYLTTTQPGDALSLEYGNPVSNVTHPDGSQTLTFSTQEDLARVRIQLGDAPLPRVLGLSNETYTTTVAIGPPEVEFLAHAEDAWKPVSALPVVSDEDVTGTGVVPEDARFRVRAEVYWLRHPPVGGVDNPPPANKSRFFVADK